MKTDYMIPKITALTDEEINVRIAEACVDSHECCRCSEPAKIVKYGAFFCQDMCAERASDHTLDDGQQEMPAYCSDLNAMAIAERVLDGKAHPSATTDERREFRDELAKLMGVAWYQSADLLRATAKQRAIAFLLALGKAGL